MKIRLADLLLLFVPIAFGAMYFAPWFADRPIRWEKFSTTALEKYQSEGETVLIWFKPRLGFLNELAETKLQHPVLINAYHSGRFVAMDYEFGYAEKIPDGEHDEIVFLMAQDVYHKDSFVVVVHPNRKTVPISIADDPEMDSVISALAVKSNRGWYLWLGVASLGLWLGWVFTRHRRERQGVERQLPS